MKIELYAIKDVKVAFMNPFTMQNVEQAKRAFKNGILTTEMSKDIYDYELWYIGTFNDKTAEIENDAKYVCSGGDFAGALKNEN